jgi:hypothetical protein
MKKAWAEAKDKQSDRERLQALTMPLPEGGELDYVCGYDLGYFLEVDIGNATLLIEEYQGGKMTHSGTAEFARPERSASDSSSFTKNESTLRKSRRRKS